MDLETFIQTYTGYAVSVDGITENYGQCLQLVALFQHKVQQTPVFFTPAASDYWTKFVGSPLEDHYDRVTDGYPIRGDIVVFSSGIGAPQGHIDVCTVAGTPGGFTGFDSNWGGVKDTHTGTPGYGYPAAHQVAHNSNFVYGYLRLKGETMDKVDKGALDLLFKGFRDAAPTQADYDKYIGSDYPSAIYDIANSPETKAHQDLVVEYYLAWEREQQGGATVLKPGQYLVK